MVQSFLPHLSSPFRHRHTSSPIDRQLSFPFFVFQSFRNFPTSHPRLQAPRRRRSHNNPSTSLLNHLYSSSNQITQEFFWAKTEALELSPKLSISSRSVFPTMYQTRSLTQVPSHPRRRSHGYCPRSKAYMRRLTLLCVNLVYDIPSSEG